MENYFNYFTEIEEHFWRKRGTAILLTTLDWALIDSWKQADIPLEAILRGIDRAFDKSEQRKSRTRRVNSLAYCHQAVLEAAGEMERGQLPHDSTPPPFPHEALAEYLEKNAVTVDAAASRILQQGRADSAGDMRAIAASLREQAALAKSGEAVDLQALEQRMSILEEKMFGILKQSSTENSLVEIRAERDRQLAPFRAKMSTEQVRQLESQFESRKLLELNELPRLSLFYL
jgi:hypothetical protein